MADYAKMKNAELETLLKERGLAHTGKKADLVKRLQDHDAENNTAAPAKADAAEDEIDWDDEPATTEASKPTTEPAATAVAASGLGQVPNPQAVPNQEAAIDPAETKDLSVVEPAPETAPETVPETESQSATEAPPATEEKPAVDFSAGIAKTTLEQEIEKRKARAKKFGLDESTDETLKTLERAKRFGGTDLPGRLNEALPEKREKKQRGEKRARDAPNDDAARKRTRPGPGGRNQRGRRDGGKVQSQRTGGGNSQHKMSDADKAKAEARKAKFASTA
ncbi:hypothetical protein BDV97DRAFT_291499 [Delphinella strobiligena]|nr:hypothetical protein BDV97DRAFT_291499 [Delphinella strobiligena]